MVFQKEKLEFNEEQKKAIEELKTKNEEKIKELIKILKDYKQKMHNLDEGSKQFWDIMTSLEKSNSHYPVGHFSNYYYKNFEEPVGESFLLEWGDKNSNFRPITEQDKKVFESKFPDYDKYSQIISDTIETIGEFLSNALSENSFIKRLAGLQEKYDDLEKLNGNWWYPQAVSEKEYGVRGTFAVYDYNLTINIPYHRMKMMKYDRLFNTNLLLANKIEKIILILKSINSYLPFAELIPVENMPKTIINVEANANNESTSVGDSNQFKGDAVVGEGGKIGK
jgi:hypothetical protein